MWKLVILGCGVCVAYFAGRFSIWKIREQIVESGAGDGSSTMSILAKGVLCLQNNIGPWSPQDVVLGLAAMAKVTEKEPLDIPGRPVGDLLTDAKFLMKAQHWRAMAEAIYVTDPASFSLFSHLPESFIVAAQYCPDQNTLRPAYALVIDPSYEALVLSIRGTYHVIDLLINAGASPVPFMGGHAHSGFARATEALLEEVRPIISNIFNEVDSVGRLVIVGHSMGAAVAIMCGLKLRDEFQDLECWGYSVPASLNMELARECAAFATCFVSLHDVVPRFSLASVEELRQRVCNFDWKRAEEVAGGDEDWERISKAVQMMENFQNAQENFQMARDNFQEFQNKVCHAVSGNPAACASDNKCDGKCKDEEQGIEPLGLHPPGRLLVLASDPPGCGKTPCQRSDVAQQRNYGAFPSFHESRNVKWRMHEAAQEDFSQIVLSPWSVSDHMLGNLCEGIGFFQRHCQPANVLL